VSCYGTVLLSSTEFVEPPPPPRTRFLGTPLGGAWGIYGEEEKGIQGFGGETSRHQVEHIDAGG